jgi:DNA polymerase V
MEKDEIKLVAENKNYKPIKITKQMQFEIWGVVRTVIHSLL